MKRPPVEAKVSRMQVPPKITFEENHHRARTVTRIEKSKGEGAEHPRSVEFNSDEKMVGNKRKTLFEEDAREPVAVDRTTAPRVGEPAEMVRVKVCQEKNTNSIEWA